MHFGFCSRIFKNQIVKNILSCFFFVCLIPVGSSLNSKFARVKLLTHLSLAVKRQSKMSMRAVRVHEFGGPEVLKIEDIPVPQVEPHKVLIRVASIGVNQVDALIRMGFIVQPPRPFIPGMDGAGVVESVGTGVTRFKKGDRVFFTRTGSGAYAEFSLIPENGVWHLPDRVTFAQGAALGVPHFTAYRALFQKAHAKPGQTVLVHGASGAVGVAAVQMARAAGLTVIGTGGTAEGLALVNKCGAHFTFNHRDTDYQAKILEVSGKAGGVDIILEMAGDVNLPKDFTLLKTHGTVVVIGNHGTCTINPQDIMLKEIHITAVMLLLSTDNEWIEAGAAIQGGLEAGYLDPVVDKQYPIDQVAQAHKDVMAGGGAKGKLVLMVATSCGTKI